MKETKKDRVPGKTVIRMGNIFEGGMDLTVLPCSAKKTISSASRRWVELFDLVPPEAMDGILSLGAITKPVKFPAKSDITKNYVWAASVFNDSTSSDAIRAIGANLGRLAAKRKTLRNLEAPMLGTGAGGLSNENSAKALAQGFIETSPEYSTLHLFIFDRERFTALETTLAQGRWGAMWDAVQIKPGAFGVTLDVKKLLPKR